ETVFLGLDVGVYGGHGCRGLVEEATDRSVPLAAWPCNFRTRQPACGLWGLSRSRLPCQRYSPTMTLRVPIAIAAIISTGLLHAQLNVSTAMTPTQLVENVLLGGGVTATNITFTGPASSRASFTTISSNLGLGAGVILCTGDATTIADNAASGVGTSTGGGSDNDLVMLSGQDINDASSLELDFVPSGDSL